ncbi:hypothetical protein B0J11DRAFT_508920 [Dendryphion nanum]|uniref:Uncharacterized protein n=1 Tax=Dendryphion nanum TaxID=256645 RepID=A0A9P9DGZ0_9PLEO|nr:hypothetical protein B0J11DRAFT_508920 [Dendryphion nanum]
MGCSSSKPKSDQDEDLPPWSTHLDQMPTTSFHQPNDYDPYEVSPNEIYRKDKVVHGNTTTESQPPFPASPEEKTGNEVRNPIITATEPQKESPVSPISPMSSPSQLQQSTPILEPRPQRAHTTPITPITPDATITPIKHAKTIQTPNIFTFRPEFARRPHSNNLRQQAAETTTAKTEVTVRDFAGIPKDDGLVKKNLRKSGERGNDVSEVFELGVEGGVIDARVLMGRKGEVPRKTARAVNRTDTDKVKSYSGEFEN